MSPPNAHCAGSLRAGTEPNRTPARRGIALWFVAFASLVACDATTAPSAPDQRGTGGSTEAPAAGGMGSTPPGAGGSLHSGGMGGDESGGAAGEGNGRGLRRVLAYHLVDVHPTTGLVRGHTGGGADEELLHRLGRAHGFEVQVTDDGTAFTPENLADVDVVVFASPHYAGQVLTNEQRAAIEAFVRGGGGWVGWHYALKVELTWPFRRVLGGGVTLGAHGRVEPAEYRLENTRHPATEKLPSTFDVNDDYLAIQGDLRGNREVSVLATATLASEPGGDHPSVWCHTIDRGRAFYSMPGHAAGPFREDWYENLMLGALRWAARVDD